MRVVIFPGLRRLSGFAEQECVAGTIYVRLCGHQFEELTGGSGSRLDGRLAILRAETCHASARRSICRRA